MSLSGSDLLLLTVGQTFATVIPTLIITGFSFLSLIQVGLSSTPLPNHDRLQIALLITTVLGAIGSVVSCYAVVQLIGLFADRYLKVNNATKLAQDVKDVLKKRLSMDVLLSRIRYVPTNIRGCPLGDYGDVPCGKPWLTGMGDCLCIAWRNDTPGISRTPHLHRG